MGWQPYLPANKIPSAALPTLPAWEPAYVALRRAAARAGDPCAAGGGGVLRAVASWRTGRGRRGAAAGRGIICRGLPGGATARAGDAGGSRRGAGLPRPVGPRDAPACATAPPLQPPPAGDSQATTPCPAASGFGAAGWVLPMAVVAFDCRSEQCLLRDFRPGLPSV